MLKNVRKFFFRCLYSGKLEFDKSPIIDKINQYNIHTKTKTSSIQNRKYNIDINKFKKTIDKYINNNIETFIENLNFIIE